MDLYTTGQLVDGLQQKKENRFSLNGNGIMSCFLGRQFFLSFHPVVWEKRNGAFFSYLCSQLKLSNAEVNSSNCFENILASSCTVGIPFPQRLNSLKMTTAITDSSRVEIIKKQYFTISSEAGWNYEQNSHGWLKTSKVARDKKYGGCVPLKHCLKGVLFVLKVALQTNFYH